MSLLTQAGAGHGHSDVPSGVTVLGFDDCWAEEEAKGSDDEEESLDIIDGASLRGGATFTGSTTPQRGGICGGGTSEESSGIQ